MKKEKAFTLVEMMVVIAIIAIVAALVVHMAIIAKRKQHEAQVEGMKQKLILLIANYQSKLNFYPPDNANLGNIPGNVNYAVNYEGYSATNPLLYELTGATNNYPSTGYVALFDGTSNTTIGTGSDYYDVFARNGVQNGNSDEPHDFFQPGPQPKEYTNYLNADWTNLSGLIVPVPLDPTKPKNANYWHYDASSTSRHNLSSYDLWAEFYVGTKGGTNIIVTNGNW